MNIMLNSTCNLKCPYCFASDSMEHKINKDEMSNEDFEYVLDFMDENNMDVVKLLGGEPTLHTNITGFMNLVVEKGFKHLILFTNGLYSNRISDSLITLHSKIKLSVLLNLNSPMQMGMSQFDSIIQNIRRINEENIGLSIGINLYRPDLDIGFLKKTLIDYKIKNLRWSIAVPNMAEIDDFDVDEYYSSMVPLIMDLLAYCYKNDIISNCDCHHVPICYFSPEDIRKMIVYEPSYFISKKCQPIIDVYPDLSVIRCFGTSDMAIKKLKDFASYKQLQLSFMLGIDHKTSNNFSKEECNECILEKNECRSGCISLLRFRKKKNDLRDWKARQAI